MLNEDLSFKEIIQIQIILIHTRILSISLFKIDSLNMSYHNFGFGSSSRLIWTMVLPIFSPLNMNGIDSIYFSIPINTLSYILIFLLRIFELK
jgi:hypothetical protein